MNKKLKDLRSTIERAIDITEDILAIRHGDFTPSSGPTEGQRNRLARIAFVLNGVVRTGGHLYTVELLQGQRKGKEASR